MSESRLLIGFYSFLLLAVVVTLLSVARGSTMDEVVTLLGGVGLFVLLPLWVLLALAETKIAKRWEGHWNGHAIRVENWFDFRFQTGEELYIDNGPVGVWRQGNKYGGRLRTKLVHGSVEHWVEARVGQSLFGMTCRVFVDETEIPLSRVDA
jgi:hypothetical protein